MEKRFQVTLSYIIIFSIVAIVAISLSVMYLRNAVSTTIGRQNAILNATFYVSGNGKPVCNPTSPIVKANPTLGESCLVFVTEKPLPNIANYTLKEISNNDINQNDVYTVSVISPQKYIELNNSPTNNFTINYDNTHITYLGTLDNYYEYVIYYGNNMPRYSAFNLGYILLSRYSPNIKALKLVNQTAILPIDNDLIVKVIFTNQTIGDIPIVGNFGPVQLVPLPQVLAYVPITITNNQNVSTTDPYDQMFVINSAMYSKYEKSGLQNVEFTTGPRGTGTPLQAWIENGASNTSTDTIVWVRIPFSLQAHSNSTIYMDFMSNNVMSSSGPTGEAPELSSTYGEYDNGNNVFIKYWNFNGTNLPVGWKTYLHQGFFGIVATYYETDINKPFLIIDDPSTGLMVTGISTELKPDTLPFAFIFYPGVSYWEFQSEEGSLFVLLSSSAFGLNYFNSTGTATFPMQMGLGYDNSSISSFYEGNFTNILNISNKFESHNYIFLSTLGLDFSQPDNVTVNNGLNLNLPFSSTETNFVAIASYPPHGIMPTYTFGSVI